MRPSTPPSPVSGEQPFTDTRAVSTSTDSCSTAGRGTSGTTPKEVVYVKDQVAIPIDRRISVGKPADMSDLKKRTTIFRADGVDMRDDKEVTMYGLRIHKLRTLGGYQPWKVKGE